MNYNKEIENLKREVRNLNRLSKLLAAFALAASLYAMLK